MKTKNIYSLHKILIERKDWKRFKSVDTIVSLMDSRKINYLIFYLSINNYFYDLFLTRLVENY